MAILHLFLYLSTMKSVGDPQRTARLKNGLHTHRPHTITPGKAGVPASPPPSPEAQRREQTQRSPRLCLALGDVVPHSSSSSA